MRVQRLMSDLRVAGAKPWSQAPRWSLMWMVRPARKANRITLPQLCDRTVSAQV